ncbi:MAG TPA: hypothetical protein VGP93_13120, partial [Polyangiaceae bacterium]|nr:hypothetical protein [Polyangiaceae bacterium]
VTPAAGAGAKQTDTGEWWIGTGIASPYQWGRISTGPDYSSVAAWTINPTSGSDAPGSTTVKTGAELSRRLAGAIITQAVTITIVGDLLYPDYLALDYKRGPGGAVRVVGTPTATLAAGTFTSVGALNRATPTMGFMVDTALSGSWSALGLIKKRIRRTSDNARAILIKDENAITAKRVRPSAWHIPSFTNPLNTNALLTATSPVVGDAYVVEQLPKIDCFTSRHCMIDGGSSSLVTGLVVDSIDFGVSAGRKMTLLSYGERTYLVGCTNCNLQNISGYNILVGSSVTQGAIGSWAQPPTGFTQFQAAAFISGGALAAQEGATCFVSDDTVAQGVNLRARYNGTVIFTGNAAVFDMAGDAVTIAANSSSNVLSGTVYGNGNTGVGVNCDGLMTYVAGSQPTVTGTTGDSKVGGTVKTWAQIPYYDNVTTGARIFVPNV